MNCLWNKTMETQTVLTLYMETSQIQKHNCVQISVLVQKMYVCTLFNYDVSN